MDDVLSCRNVSNEIEYRAGNFNPIEEPVLVSKMKDSLMEIDVYKYKLQYAATKLCRR